MILLRSKGRLRPVSCVSWSLKVNDAVECSVKALLHIPFFCKSGWSPRTAASSTPPGHLFLPFITWLVLHSLVIDLALRRVHCDRLSGSAVVQMIVSSPKRRDSTFKGDTKNALFGLFSCFACKRVLKERSTWVWCLPIACGDGGEDIRALSWQRQLTRSFRVASSVLYIWKKNFLKEEFKNFDSAFLLFFTFPQYGSTLSHPSSSSLPRHRRMETLMMRFGSRWLGAVHPTQPPPSLRPSPSS